MPKERDEERLALLLRLLADTASNVVLFKERAFRGSGEPDDLGLDHLLPPELSREQKKQRLKTALAESVRQSPPNRVDVPGDKDMDLDPAVFYEFRFVLAGTPVYVKTELKEDDPAEPILIVMTVKRQN